VAAAEAPAIAEEPPPTTLPWEAPAAVSAPAPPAPTVEPVAPIAATIVPDEGHESTTLMPAWQPPPPPPTGGPVDTVVMGGPAQPATRTTPGAAGRQAELTIESGPDAGHTYRAGVGALRLGRSPDNDLILRDPATSGHHARVERRGEQFFIVDLGSTNGTLVNGEPIQEKELNHDDRITIGQNAVHFSVLGS
jgi:pSer/pThr/pTyr-binding forkhead associated (FHA) protein